MTSCPADDRLAQFLADGLLPAAAEELEDHLAACAACRQRLEELSCDDSAVRLRELYQRHEVAVVDPELSFLRGLPCVLRAEGPSPVEFGAVADTPQADGSAQALRSLPTVPGYEVQGELGRGGMGVVYKARHRQLNRLVALKMILSGALAGPMQRTRFLVEAETLARLHHPNVVQIYEIGTYENCPYFALEYVDGGTLADRLRDGALPSAAAAALIETLARAIHAAHLQGVIHRDLKPANVLLSADGQPKITDFGLAKLVVGHPDLTQTGVVAGTPAYMAPEQATGDSRALTPAVDVYALGTILYQALTGRPPFDGQEPALVLARLASGETPSLAKFAGRLPRDLVTICTRCLEREPARRYPSAEALADDLGRYLRGEPIQARSVGEWERLWKWARRRRALAATLTTLVVALVAGTAISTYFAVVAGRREEEARASEGKAQAARRQAEAQAARAEFARGFDLASQGETVRGLHTMLAAAGRAPPDEAELQRVLRTNVAAWSVPLFDLRHVVAGESGRPLDLAFSPDGRTFAALWQDGAQLYDTASGQAVGDRLRCPGGRCLAFSPDGRRLLAGARSGSLCAWDTATRAEVPAQPAVPGPDILHMGFSPGGQTLYTAHGDGIARLWDTATGKRRGEAIRGVHGHFPLRFAPDGRSLFGFIAEPPPVRLGRWNAETGRPEEAPAVDGVLNYALDPDGATVLLLRDGAAQRYDLRTGRALGEPLALGNLLGALPGRPQEFVATPNGSCVLAQDQLGTYVLWDLTTRRRLGEVMRLDAGRCVFSPDGRFVASAGEPGVLRLWEVNATAWRAGAADSGRAADTPIVHQVVFTPDGRTAAQLLGDRTVQLWDTGACRPVGRPLRHPYPLRHVVSDSAGKRLAVTCYNNDLGPNNLLQVWDIATQQSLWAAPQPRPAMALAFSPDGRTLAAGGYTTAVGLFDAATGRRTGADLPAGAIVQTLLFTPDGKVLAAGLWNTNQRPGGIQLFDVDAGRPRLPFLPHGVPVPPGGLAVNAECLDAISPDGRVLITHGGEAIAVGPRGIATYQINAWEVATGQPFFAPLKGSATVKTSPDGRTLVSVDWDGHTLHLRDAATGEVRPHGVLNLPGRLAALAYSPDGRTLAAAYDNRAQLWDVDTGLPLGPPVGQAGALVGAGFTDGGRTLVTISAAGWVRRWPVPTAPTGDLENLAARVCVRTQARVEANGVLVYLDGPALTECGQKVRAAGVESPPGTTAAWHDLAAAAAEESGDAAAARRHLRRLVELQPDAWRTHARLARLHRMAGEEKEAKGAYERALRFGQRSDLLDWSEQRAAAAQAAGELAQALWYQDQLTAAEPEEWRHFAARADLLGQLGRTAEREDDLKRAAARGGDVSFLVRLAEEWAVKGRWPEVAALFQRALPLGTTAWHHAGLAALKAGDAAGYRRVCAAVLAAPAATSSDESNNRAAVIALGPDGVTDWSGPLRLVEQALAGLDETLQRRPELARQPGIATTRHAYLNTKGALLCRAGRYAEAIDVLNDGIAVEGGQPLPHDAFLLALAYQHLPRNEEPQAWLDRGRKLLGPEPSGGDLWTSLELQLLKEEATRALRK
jgi:WD40 repeat protein/tRNA A-37 threonylcarbamoyl transferase component Bud32/tetratricopeptide (TPR) repeat protein